MVLEVLGLELPIAEFLLFLNIAMLFYIVFSMIELRNLRKLRRELALQLGEIRFLVKRIRFSPAIEESIEEKTPSVEPKVQEIPSTLTPPTPSSKEVKKIPSTPKKTPPTPELPDVEEETTKE